MSNCVESRHTIIMKQEVNKKKRFNTKYLKANPNARNRTASFKEGNPGRPLGAVSKTTLLKDKLVSYALQMNLDEKEERSSYDSRGRKIKSYFRTIPKRQILSLASSLLPKEMTVKGIPESKVFTNIQIGKTEAEIVDSLNSRFMKQFSKEKSTEPTISQDPA